VFHLAGPVFMIVSAAAANAPENPAATIERPVRIIYDTDMGNDVDDALALGVIHSLQSRKECELLAVTITKDEESCAPYIDAVNTFYGRSGIPIGVVRKGVTPGVSKFTPLANQMDNGKPRYPHDLKNGKDAPEATEVLRKVLAAQPDHSVVIAQVGFSTNLARLLDTPADKYSKLNGRDLVAKKVAVLSLMAGAFELIKGKEHPEYNVVKDIPAAKKIANEWPTTLVYSGYEIGLSIPYPAASILEDFNYVEHHPLSESYQLYMPTPHERPTWDLTSVLWGVRPNRGYFDISPAGRVAVDDKGLTTFEADPKGKHYYLIASEMQRAVVCEALAQLASQPPTLP
jgi:inosine-uridine nucleoside N-ribohydrolase